MYVLATCGLCGIGTTAEPADLFVTDPHKWRIPHPWPTGGGSDAALTGAGTAAGGAGRPTNP